MPHLATVSILKGSINPTEEVAVTPLTAMALRATLHCLTGCAIGEVTGLAIGTALGWATAPTMALAIGLAFLFGYALTGSGLVRGGMGLRAAAGVALAADTVSIAVMEVVDNAVMLARARRDGRRPRRRPVLGCAGVRPGRGLRRGGPGQPVADRPGAGSRGGPPRTTPTPDGDDADPAVAVAPQLEQLVARAVAPGGQVNLDQRVVGEQLDDRRPAPRDGRRGR